MPCAHSGARTGEKEHCRQISDAVVESPTLGPRTSLGPDQEAAVPVVTSAARRRNHIVEHTGGVANNADMCVGGIRGQSVVVEWSTH